jgi:hypothetical protein
MNDKIKNTESGSGGITIDYTQPDVEDIMSQIKDRIASRSQDKNPPAPEGSPQPLPPPPPEDPEPVWEPLPLSGVKKVLFKLTRPFAPLIKLLVLPVHRELLETVHRLDYTNRRLDFLNRRMDLALEHLSRELYESTDALNRKVDTFNDAANQRLDKAFHDLGRTMEYTKLLHSLAHNLVVEMSKLKIEEEDLKTKTRIMEKDFEFVRSKEQALEHQVFNRNDS